MTSNASCSCNFIDFKMKMIFLGLKNSQLFFQFRTHAMVLSEWRSLGEKKQKNNKLVIIPKHDFFLKTY